MLPDVLVFEDSPRIFMCSTDSNLKNSKQKHFKILNFSLLTVTVCQAK